MKRTYKYKVCFLGFAELSDIAKEVLRRNPFPNLEVLLTECTPDNLSEQVGAALQQGCEAFIAGSSNAAEFRRISNLPLTEIHIQTLDYVLALRKAFCLGKQPALFTYRFSKMPNLSLIRKVLNRSFLHIIYEDTYDLGLKLGKIKADVVVGASMVNSMAQPLQKKSVLLYPGSSAVEDALRRCELALSSLYLRSRNQAIYRSIIDHDVNGILCVNEKDEIILYNPAAEKITGVPIRQTRRKRSRDLFPWAELDAMLRSDEVRREKCLEINGCPVETTSFKIEVNQNIVGALMLLMQKNTASASAPAARQSPPPNPQRSFERLRFTSEAMAEVVADAKAYSTRSEPCMIIGEVGTGRSFFADAIHQYANSENRRLYRVNCGTIPPRQAVQYFFGREGKDGHVIHRGVLEVCGQSTLILENIQDIEPASQNCLAQAIKTGYIQRVNGREFIPVNARILTTVSAAEWETLPQKISQELFYVLSPLLLRLPPLRKRTEDIPLLFEMFVNDRRLLRTNTFKPFKTLLPIFHQYSWPGNLRELENVACRFAILLDKRGKLTPAGQRNVLIASIGEDELFRDLVGQFGELEKIRESPKQVLELTEKLKEVMSYNNEQIAKKLGISRTTLWRVLNSTRDGTDPNSN